MKHSILGFLFGASGRPSTANPSSCSVPQEIIDDINAALRKIDFDQYADGIIPFRDISHVFRWMGLPGSSVRHALRENQLAFADLELPEYRSIEDLNIPLSILHPFVLRLVVVTQDWLNNTTHTSAHYRSCDKHVERLTPSALVPRF